MHISIRSTQKQKEELLQKGFTENVFVEWLAENENFNHSADALFDLTFNDAQINSDNLIDDMLVFASAVNCTCTEINKKNYVRINSWQGFLNRSIIEVAACNEQYKQRAAQILDALKWRYVFTPDDYGFIAPRILAMIINEAYFALQEKVSTKQQIDIAMKLGTNYPYGPFEWSEKIGIEKIYWLLKKLSEKNKRYTIAYLLEQETLNNFDWH
jgi:3-hydroxybutyryl-CoA dehydrogenase